MHSHEEHQKFHQSILRSWFVDFTSAMTSYSTSAFQWFQHQGFWREDHRNVGPSYGLPETITLPREEYLKLKKMEKIALIHSELSEMVEGIRNNIPHGEKGCETEELADTLVRMLDYAGGFDLPLPAVYIDKMKKNFDRPHRHGKAF